MALPRLGGKLLPEPTRPPKPSEPQNPPFASALHPPSLPGISGGAPNSVFISGQTAIPGAPGRGRKPLSSSLKRPPRLWISGPTVWGFQGLESLNPAALNPKSPNSEFQKSLGFGGGGSSGEPATPASLHLAWAPGRISWEFAGGLGCGYACKSALTKVPTMLEDVWHSWVRNHTCVFP